MRILKILSVGGGPGKYFRHHRISQRAVQTSLEKQFDPQLGPRVPLASRQGCPGVDLPSGSVQEEQVNSTLVWLK